jgi:hypothetical protein
MPNENNRLVGENSPNLVTLLRNNDIGRRSENLREGELGVEERGRCKERKILKSQSESTLSKSSERWFFSFATAKASILKKCEHLNLIKNHFFIKKILW